MYTGKSGNTHGEKKLNIPCKKTVKNEIFILETFIQHISYSRRISASNDSTAAVFLEKK
jgi:hypothetical protein